MKLHFDFTIDGPRSAVLGISEDVMNLLNHWRKVEPRLVLRVASPLEPRKASAPGKRSQGRRVRTR